MRRVRETWRALMVAGLIVAASTSGRAQEPQMPRGEPIPDEFLGPGGQKPAVPDPNMLPWSVWVAADGFVPRALPSPEGEPCFGRAGLEFMEECQVLADVQGPDRNYLLLGKADPLSRRAVDRVLGWVPKDFVAESNSSLLDRGTTIQHKALLIADIDDKATLQEAVGEGSNRIPLLAEPQADARAITDYALMNIFWIYARSPAYVPVGPNGPERPQYLLVGAAPSFSTQLGPDGPQGPKAIVKGWVEASRALEWNTREGFSWDRKSTEPTANPRRTEPAEIFVDYRQAYEAFYPEVVRNAKDKPTGEHLIAAEEAFANSESGDGKVSVPFSPGRMRYPKLSWNGKDGYPKTNPGSRTNDLYYVAASGGAGGASEEEIVEMRAQLAEIKQRLGGIDVLFLIDDTGTMDRHFPTVAAIVEAMCEEVMNLPGDSTRVAVSFYNDTDQQPPGWNPVDAQPLVDARQRGLEVAARVRNHRPVNGGDAPEMVFRGIKEAVTAARFARDSRKMIILVGETGDRVDETTEVAAALVRPGSTPIELRAIQVGDPDLIAETRAFRAQMESLREKMNKLAGYQVAAYLTPDKEDLATLLSRSHRELQAQRDRLNNEIERIRSGEANPTQFGDDTKKTLARYGFDYDEWERKTRGEVQLVRRGFVWRYARDLEGEAQQVRLEYLMSRKELEDLLQVVKPLLLLKGEGGAGVKAAVEKAVRSVTGDKVDGNPSYEDIFKKLFGLEKTQSPLMRVKIGDLATNFDEQDLEELAYRAQLIQDALDGVERDYTRKTLKKVGDRTISYYEPSVESRPRKRSFTLPHNDVDYFWIDAETEMP